MTPQIVARARAVLSRLREVPRRQRIRRELDEEVHTHIELETAYNIAHGMSPADARRAARLAFGGVDRFREEASDARGVAWIDELSRNLRFALRQLRRTPAFASSVVASLAIGIGATTSVFTVFHSVLQKPLPYPNGDRLVGVWYALPRMRFDRAPLPLSTYFTDRRFATTLDGMAVFDRADVNVAASRDDAHPDRVRIARATASLFPLLGAPIVAGRPFTAHDDTPVAPPVAVISEGLWQRRFGGRASAIGSRLLIDGRSYEIVGVAARRFHFPDESTELWVPLALDSAASFGGAFSHQAIARLGPGATPDAAQRELAQLSPRVSELYPNIAPGMPMASFLAEAGASPVVRPLRDDVVGGFRTVVAIAAIAGALLLLISFANVTSLLLARSEARRRELAVRIALGAGARRVLAQLFAESIVLAVIGGACGLGLAIVGVRLLVSAAPANVPRLSDIAVDGSVLAFVGLLTLTMGALCSLVPALRYDPARLSERLRDAARGATAGRDRQRTRRLLVVAQVAFATLLVSGASLMFQSLRRLHRVDPGFDAGHALTLWLSLPTATYPHDSDEQRVMEQVTSRISRLAGVRAVGLGSRIPLYAAGSSYTPVWSDADHATSATLPPSVSAAEVTGGYFAALGIPLVAGRVFSTGDQQNPYEVIIDRSMARQYWGDSTGQRAIGRRVRLAEDQNGNSWYTVIGVVGSVADTSLAAPRASALYLPAVAAPDTNRSVVPRSFAIVVRTAGDPRALRSAVEQAIATVDRSVPPFSVDPMNVVLERSLAQLWFIMVVIGVTATVALVLAAIGLYGILTFTVTARRKELSLRLAMGALPSAVVRLVGLQATQLTLAGIVAGVAIFVLASRILASRVNGIGAPVPVTVAATSLVLLVIAFLSAWVPARRAARTDPAAALAAE